MIKFTVNVPVSSDTTKVAFSFRTATNSGALPANENEKKLLPVPAKEEVLSQ